MSVLSKFIPDFTAVKKRAQSYTAFTRKKNRRYMFISKHYPVNPSFNEIHVCNIAQVGNRERGWYLNSLRRISKIDGRRFTIFGYGIAVGKVNGYGRTKGQQKRYHTYVYFLAPNRFYVPVFLSFLVSGQNFMGTNFISCRYFDDKPGPHYRMFRNKYMEQAKYLKEKQREEEVLAAREALRRKK